MRAPAAITRSSSRARRSRASAQRLERRARRFRGARCSASACDSASAAAAAAASAAAVSLAQLAAALLEGAGVVGERRDLGIEPRKALRSARRRAPRRACAAPAQRSRSPRAPATRRGAHHLLMRRLLGLQPRFGRLAAVRGEPRLQLVALALERRRYPAAPSSASPGGSQLAARRVGVGLDARQRAGEGREALGDAAGRRSASVSVARRASTRADAPARTARAAVGLEMLRVGAHLRRRLRKSRAPSRRLAAPIFSSCTSMATRLRCSSAARACRGGAGLGAKAVPAPQPAVARDEALAGGKCRPERDRRLLARPRRSGGAGASGSPAP